MLQYHRSIFIFRALDSGFNSENHSSVIGNDAPSGEGEYVSSE